ncbi:MULTISPECIES: hypothetical protein [unclassified Streptomyces]|uniref:hypothetical protein n=1 Tax=unclassified Streptomyces TaxID=2593676 RepID=UPI002119BCD6|nr:hypothetical protein [Streptomyces sp. 13-12-16]
MRTVLVPAEAGGVIVLTFAHQITDGTGGVRVVADLVAALDCDEEGGEAAPGGGCAALPGGPPATSRRCDAHRGPAPGRADERAR